jgi:serine protease Do
MIAKDLFPMVSKFKILIALAVVVSFAVVSPAEAQFFGRKSENKQQQAQPAAPSATPASFADMVEVLLPAVVNISSVQNFPEETIEEMDMPDFHELPEGSPFEDFFEQFMDQRGGEIPNIPPASLGSGFVVDAENGIIITNNHVVRDSDEVRVTFHDDETVEAEVVGRDEKTDLAVLRVTTDHPMTDVNFGDSDVLRVGDWIVAIGNPFGLGGTVTAGIVSARQRDISSGPYDDYIQTDASINRGNSGGPMFNLKGEVIGINTAIFSPSGGSVGIGFAIPSAQAEPVVDQILKYGRTRRGWLGVRIQTVTDEIAESLGLDEARGALVASITTDGPAEAADLKNGDIILNFNGVPVEEMKDLPRIVAETPIEENVSLTFWRDEKEQYASVLIGELEKAEEDGLLTNEPTQDVAEESDTGQEIEKLSLTVSEITDSLKADYGLSDSIKGVVVTDVDPRSGAAAQSIMDGDVIVEINQKVAETPKDINTAIEKAEEAGRPSVLILIERHSERRFVALKLKASE